MGERTIVPHKSVSDIDINDTARKIIQEWRRKQQNDTEAYRQLCDILKKINAEPCGNFKYIDDSVD